MDGSFNIMVGSVFILVFSPGHWWWRWCSWACNPQIFPLPWLFDDFFDDFLTIFFGDFFDKYLTCFIQCNGRINFSPGFWWWRWCSWTCNPFTMAMRRRGCRGRTWDRRNPTKASVGLRGRNALTGNPVPEGYSRITSNSNSWCGLYHKRRRHIIWHLRKFK